MDMGNIVKNLVSKKQGQEEQTGKIKAIKITPTSVDLPRRLKGLYFENYSPTCENAKRAHETCKQFCHNFESSGGMVLVGSVGTGKTHMAVAICHEMARQGKNCKFTTVATIVREINESWSADRTKKDTYGVSIESDFESDIIRKYSRYDLLVIDEIGSQYGSDTERIVISEIINNRYNNVLPTIVLGNVTLSEVKEAITVRAVDRVLHNGNVVVFDWKSYRE